MGRRAGVDVRAAGSGNIGATNVARSAGVGLGLLTLAADVAKGALPVAAARAAGMSSAAVAAVALSAFYGHIFSAFAGFRGGKGVATGAGAFLALSPIALAGAAAVFLVVAFSRRIVSAASVCAGISLPVFVLAAGGAGPRVWAAIAVAVSLVWTHRANLRRLARGSEPRFQVRNS